MIKMFALYPNYNEKPRIILRQEGTRSKLSFKGIYIAAVNIFQGSKVAKEATS